ncbi:MAG: PaaI family thioesterase [Candidatus Dormibacteria bacterium]
MSLPGLERMQRADGSAPPPPIHHLTGLRPTDSGPGWSNFTMPATGWWRSPAGVFTGGVLAFLSDGPLGGAIITRLPPGRMMTTAELSMSFLRPASVDSGLMTGRGQVVHQGRSVALTEVRCVDERGLLLAHGTSRAVLLTLDLPPSGAQSPPPSFDTPDPYLREPIGDVIPAAAWETVPGLELLRMAIAGELPRPPHSYLTGLLLRDAQPDQATFTMPASEWLCSPGPSLYGGALVFLADCAMCCAVQTGLGPRTAYATLDIKAYFMRPVAPDGRDLTVVARVIHRGRTLAISECEVTNADGKPVLSAVSSTMILPGRAWGEAPPSAAEESPVPG